MKKDDELDSNIYSNLDKSLVIQETKQFNEKIIPSKHTQTLTKVLLLTNLTPEEADFIFFNCTKLFQHKDIQLRKLVYLVIKQLSKLSPNVIMATQSLAKDTNDRTAAEIGYKSNALRALCAVSNLDSVDRFIRQCIVSSDPSVSSAAMVCAYSNKEFLKRLLNELNDQLTKPQALLQYHALGCMYTLKQNDKISVMKMIQQLSKQLKSPYAYCLLIRIIAKQLQVQSDALLLDILENSLRHRNEMVNLEAARAICQVSQEQRLLFPAVSVLQLFLTSPKSTLRFSSLRTLNSLSLTNPQAVQSCNLEMENLVGDSNRSIATLAITTLLKTGSEQSVDRLMKQIQSFMSEISDEFKIIVVDAVHKLCLKFPHKNQVLLGFLSQSLRDEGGYEYKRAVVESMLSIYEELHECREQILTQLCEFIEDCEYTRLSVMILHLLGKECRHLKDYQKYIKYIYNRTILENAVVRASAVNALGGLVDKSEDVKILLRRCMDDPDDEVRERVIRSLKGQALQTTEKRLDIEELERRIVEGGDLKSVPEESEVKKREEIAAAVAVTPVPQQTLPEILKPFGNPFKSTRPFALNELDVAEYQVELIKHVYKDKIVAEYSILNTLDDLILEDVTVELSGVKGTVLSTIKQLRYNQKESIFVQLDRGEYTVKSKLLFTTRDFDPTTEEMSQGYEDEYQIEDYEVEFSDLVRDVYSVDCKFKKKETFILEMDLKEAKESIVNLLKLNSKDDTMRGEYIDGGKFELVCRMVYLNGSVTCEMVVGGDNEAIVETVMEQYV